MQTKNRFRRILFYIILAIMLVGCGGITAIMLEILVVIDSGSPRLAEEWKTLLNPVDNLNQGRTVHPDVHFLEFPNGEWIIWLARNSHGFFHSGGGTVVVKDSRGSTRAYFGHVCGEGNIFGGIDKSLDEFYAQLELRYREQN